MTAYIRPKAIYFLYYAALACLAPFLTLYYLERGMNGAQIGLLSGIVPLVMWASAPVWGGIADARNRHKAVLLLIIAGAWLSVVALAFATTFATLLITVTAYAFFLGATVSLIDNAVMGILGSRKEMYGRVRLWGSVGWGVAATLLAPVLERAGLAWSFYGFLAINAGTFVVALGLPMSFSTLQHSYATGLGTLARNGRFLLLLFAALVFGLAMGVIQSYLFLFLEELGASRSLMAYTMTITTISEIPFWFVSSALLRRFGTSKMIAFALAITAVRMFSLGVMREAWLALPISLMHGPGFAVIWAAGVADADAAAPQGLGATAQGLFSGMIFGLGSALGGFIGGPAYEALGFPRLFSITGWITLATLIFFVAVRLGPRLGRRSSTTGGTV